MSWPLQEDFKPGEPMVQVPMDWFNTVSKILNTLVTVGCTLERTACPSQETPWRLIVAAAVANSLTLSNTTPLPPGTATPGNEAAAAHGNHVHPLNFDTTIPEPIGLAGDAGTGVDTYARRNHVHALGAPADPGDQTDLGVAGEGTANTADTSSWTAGTTGVDLWVVTRVELNNNATNTPFNAYLRMVRITPDGRIYYISGETKVLISGTSTSA